MFVLGQPLCLDPANAARLGIPPPPAGEARDELPEYAAKRGRPTGEAPATVKLGATALAIVCGAAAK